MLFKLSALVSLLACTAAALPAAQSDCATCPSADQLVGTTSYTLVAGSGGTIGVPRYCGYSTDASGALGPQITCFYNNSGTLFSGANPVCPPIAPLVTCKWQ
ncbi:hypothetical protein FPV67DRAFT_1117127 [Lyophyllum atratum]|nr:hypothetical protein FPV67DRAFT_1117127 [Lyophyllum atratum]